MHLDPNIVNLLAAASAAAYQDFTNSNVPGYTPEPLTHNGIIFNYVQRFTGFDDVAWGSGKEECYALLYHSANENTVYLMAFRGTSSADDMLLDLESGASEAFKPYLVVDNFPADIHVGDGFNKIYTTKNYSMSDSLQVQLFEALKKLTNPPTKIIITGHSLGGALASLFALDIAACSPDIDVYSLTFASPRVGTSKWQTAYNQTYKLFERTIRVRNTYDLVPKSPAEHWPFDFCDIGQTFFVSFSVEKDHIQLSDIILSWHALTNYTYVTTRAVLSNPQVWTGEFPDQAHNGWNMMSYDTDVKNSALEQAGSRNEVQQLLDGNKPQKTVPV
ncbi:MAG TPA: lipase family protein [Cellvibrio sp.]|nr:lipase family protein [Cellvibrio sp.]